MRGFLHDSCIFDPGISYCKHPTPTKKKNEGRPQHQSERINDRR